MSTAYQHRPLSKILAQPAGPQPEGQANAEQPRDEQGRFAKAPEADSNNQNEPEKYRGKTRDDIIAMHQNAESAYGRSQNEVGQLRGLVKDLSQLQRVAKPATEEQQDVDLTGDELIADPVGAIKKVVQATQRPAAQDEPDSIDETLANLDIANATQALVAEFPNMEQIAMSQEFQDFVSRTPGRLRDQQIAADPNAGIAAVDSARRLLEDFRDFQQSSQPSREKPQSGVDKARAVSNEGGQRGATAPKDLIYESDVIALINSDPEKYRSPSFQAELTAAIREGRYIRQT